MKKSLVALIVVLVAGLAIAGFVVASREDAGTGTITEQNEQTHMEESGQQTDGTEAESADQVKISNFNFSPATITVKKGATVTWTNEDSTEHTVTSEDDDGLLDSGMLGRNETYSFTFDTVGTFSYFCVPHPEMKGTVIVTE